MTDSIWRNRDFLWLFTGRTLSQLGTAVTTFTIPWLLLQLTGSATQTGIAFAVGFIPYLLVSLPAGVFADRYNRKNLMILADSGRMLLLFSIPLAHLLTGEIPIALLYAVQAGVSLFAALFDAAYGACLPNLVERTQLQQGNAALQTGSSLSRIGGPVVAGMLISLVGTANTLMIDACSYAISILTIFFIRAPFSATLTTAAKQKMLADVREGLRYVWKVKTLRLLALFSMMVNLVGPGMDIALLHRIKNELLLPSEWAGLIVAALSGGLLAGSLVVGRMKKRFTMAQLLSGSSLGLVFPPFLLAWFDSPFVLIIAQFLVGFLLVAWNVQTTTLRQMIVPDHLQGRCVSLFRIIAWVSIPAGGVAAGTISEGWGAPVYFLLAGGVLSLVCLLSIKIGFGTDGSNSPSATFPQSRSIRDKQANT